MAKRSKLPQPQPKMEAEDFNAKLRTAFEVVAEVQVGLDIFSRMVEIAPDCPYLTDSEIRGGARIIVKAFSKHLKEADEILDRLTIVRLSQVRGAA